MFGRVDINFDDMFELRMSTNTRGHKYIRTILKRSISKWETDIIPPDIIHPGQKPPGQIPPPTLGRYPP